VGRRIAGRHALVVARGDDGSRRVDENGADGTPPSFRDFSARERAADIFREIPRSRDETRLRNMKSMAEVLPVDRENAFWAGVEHARRFFMGEADVQRALERLARVLDEKGVPYAVVGGLALNEWGYRRVTVDVDVLLTADGLRTLKTEVLGLGYVEKFPGSRGLRDTVTGVDIDVLITGEYPGDGKPKPVAFPDPAEVAVRGRRVALLPLAKLIELKLASGISAPHRLKDLADVLELVRTLSLPRDLADSLDAFVRAKYDELWQAAQSADIE